MPEQESPANAAGSRAAFPVVCPACRAELRRESAGFRCASCDEIYPFLPRTTESSEIDELPDLRLKSVQSEETTNQEPIWDLHSAGAPSTPVDAFECRNDLKSILFRTLSDRIDWPGEGSHTIDLGCFDGSLSRNWTLRYGTKITGVDVSAGAIARAYRADPFENDYYLAILEALPFPDESFDAALSLDVFEHLGNPEPAIREAARVLKPGSPFLFYIVSSRNRMTFDWFRYHFRRLTGQSVPERFGDDPEGGHWVENLVHPDDFRRICADANLDLEGLHPFHSFFTAVADDLARHWIVNRRARTGSAEAPLAKRAAEGKQLVLDPEKIPPAKRRRLNLVNRVFSLTELFDAPWRFFQQGRGFAAWGRKRK